MEKQITWRDDEALRRFQLISPLLDETLDKDGKLQRRKEIAEKEQISTRTLYRYEKGYRDNGFEGLKPAVRSNSDLSFPVNFSEIMQQAIQLKREVPKRSVQTIIDILELEGWAAPGVLKRSTLERHLYSAGFGVRQMQTVNDARNSSSKRFCKPHRMMLVEADIKNGPALPIGKNGKKVKTYLSSIIDNHSRLILFSKFYASRRSRHCGGYIPPGTGPSRKLRLCLLRSRIAIHICTAETEYGDARYSDQICPCQKREEQRRH